ncbi:MAG TPA: hypothetical protein VHD62_02640 [Opitutaceae bacterium]|nr:hypothetical protein [Opitutaceae bacterium]
MIFSIARARLLQLAWWIGAYLPPDRRVLERTILPRLAQAHPQGHVLFVGVKFYTRDYPRIFPQGNLVTLDRDPRVSRHGAREHIVDRLENVAVHAGRRRFAAVVVNGVIGWGIDTLDAAEAAIAACAENLVDGGWLIVGVNERRPTTPDLTRLASWRFFEPAPFPELNAARIVVPTPFAEREHTFLFFRKRAAA